MKNYSTYKNRKQAYQEREELLPTVFKGLSDWTNEIDMLTENRPWVTEQEKIDVLEKINEMRTWLEEQVQKQAESKLSEDPVFTTAQVETKFKPLDKLYKKVVTKKKPKDFKIEKTEEEEKK